MTRSYELEKDFFFMCQAYYSDRMIYHFIRIILPSEKSQTANLSLYTHSHSCDLTLEKFIIENSMGKHSLFIYPANRSPHSAEIHLNLL